MNKDIRLSMGFLDHPKTIKLERRLGWPGIKGLIRLWFFCAANKPDGNFTGMNADDIEIAAKWTGDPGIFLQALIDLRFIDQDGTGLSLHDWSEHNGYASHSKEREERARRAAAVRWTGKEVPALKPGKRDKSELEGIVKSWNEICGTTLPKVSGLNDQREGTIRARIKEYGAEKIKEAFRMVLSSGFLTGNNDRGWKANFDWVMGPKNFVKVIEGNYPADFGRMQPESKGMDAIRKLYQEHVVGGEDGMGDLP